MRIMTLHAVGVAERLSLMSLDQVCRGRIVAIQAECRSRLRQVVLEFNLGYIANFVGDVASFTAHFQSRMLAAVFGDVQSLLVAG